MRSSCTNPYQEIMSQDADDNPCAVNVIYGHAPIDAVISFVDASDSEWQASRVVWWSKHHMNAPRDANASNRFRSHGEIAFCVEGLKRFAPWIRRIFIVGASPRQNPRIPGTTFVSHDMILPLDALPTFNSHAIEASLHRIPDLLEQFIYLNDDMVIVRPVTPNMFFTPDDGRPIVSVDNASTRTGNTSTGDTGFVAAWKNVNALLDVLFGKDGNPRKKLAHYPVPLRKSAIHEIWNLLPCRERLLETTYSRFRGLRDVSTTCSLYPYYCVHTDMAVLTSSAARNVTVFNGDVPDPRGMPASVWSVCIEDDFTDDRKTGAFTDALKQFFAHYFP